MKRIIDEREEKELYKIEHYGFWGVFWLLLISIPVQIIINGGSFDSVLGESIVLFIMSIFIIAGCFKTGIYSYTSKPSQKVYLLASLVTSMAIFIFSMVYEVLFKADTTSIYSALKSSAFVGVVIFIAVYVAEFICGEVMKIRKKKLEQDE